MRKLKSTLIVFAYVVSSAAMAANEGSVDVAAAGKSRDFYVYFRATISPSTKPNPVVITGRVVMVGPGLPDGALDLTCVGGTELSKRFQSSPYGIGTEGRVIELKCGKQYGFLFALLPDGQPGDCGNEKILGHRPLAVAASFGHQAFCMEDWHGVKDPKSSLFKASGR